MAEAESGGGFFRVGGLVIRSDYALAAERCPSGPADIAIGQARGLPEALAPHAQGGVFWQALPGTFLLNVPGVGRYLCHGGERIEIEPEDGADHRKIMLFLQGTAIAAALIQRGLLPLHASAIATPGGAVLFAGPSRAGKSTMAAFLQRRGYRVLCDDICVVSLPEGDAPIAYPGFRRLNLWSDTLAALSLQAATASRVRDGIEKFYVPLDEAHQDTPLRIARFYHLQEARSHVPQGIRALNGLEALMAISNNTYRPSFVGALGCGEIHFRTCTGVARQVKTYSLRRPDALSRMDDVVDWLEAHWREDA